jgi:hypothetical protein
MKLLRRVQILARAVLTRSVLGARLVTSIHLALMGFRSFQRHLLMTRIIVANHSMMQTIHALHHVHQGRQLSVQLVKRVLLIRHALCCTRKRFSAVPRLMTQVPVRCLVKMAYVLMAGAAMRTLPVLVTSLPFRNQSHYHQRGSLLRNQQHLLITPPNHTTVECRLKMHLPNVPSHVP